MPKPMSDEQAAEPEFYPGLGIEITWPAAGTKNPRFNPPLVTWPMLIHDHETGEPLLGITGLRIALGGEQWNGEVIQADITTLVDVDGQPQLGENIKPVRDPDDPERFYSRVFRCYVFEMRIRDDKKVADSVVVRLSRGEIRVPEDCPVPDDTLRKLNQ